MTRLSSFALLIAVLTVYCTPVSAVLTEEQRQSDVQAIIDLYEHRYAPAPWKAEYLDVNLDSLVNDFWQAAAAAKSDEEFYESIARYVSGLKDAHATLSIPSSFKVWLGFDTDKVEGKIIITYIDGELLSYDSFPFEVGDRLVSIDGVSAEKILNELGEISTTGSKESDDRFNASNLTWRDQSYIPIVPTGSAKVVVEPRKGGGAKSAKVEWLEFGKPLAPTYSGLSPKAISISKEVLPRGPLERLRSIKFERRTRSSSRASTDYPNPPIFPMWSSFMKFSNGPLYAGIATIGGNKIGFVKIETFDDDDAKQTRVLNYLSQIVRSLENQTKAVIIDLTSNGGGYICYAEKILSYFISSPIEGIRSQIKPTRLWSSEFEMELEYATNETDRNLMSQMVETIRDGLVSGADLTDPMPICSYDGTIQPASSGGAAVSAYTKPIIILVNEMNASAGEMFPALLQDAGRAKVFGARTMGAGGSVVSVGPMGNSDIMITVTESLVWRNKTVKAPDGTRTNYLENIGVIPDVEYKLTIDDVVDGYKGYKTALERAVAEMVK